MNVKIWVASVSIAFGLLPMAALSQTNFTLSPSTYTTASGYYDPTYAFDGSFTSYAYAYVSERGKGAHTQLEEWSGFPPAPGGATQMTLNIRSSGSVYGVSGGTGSFAIDYSLDGGTTFTTAYMVNGGSLSVTTNTISLSDTQDLTQIIVKAQAFAFCINSLQGSLVQHQVYEIWVAGQD